MTAHLVTAGPQGAGRVAAEQPVEFALLDRHGVIVAVNDAWRAFCLRNEGDITRAGVGRSYLDLCDVAGDPGSRAVAASIRSAVIGELPAPAVITIDCPAPGLPRSFDVLVSSRFDDAGGCVGAAVTLSEVAEVSEVEQPSEPGHPAGGLTGTESSTTDSSVSLTVRARERERIAALLNDDVISQLFSIGIGLQGMLADPRPPAQQGRLQQYVDAVDAVIHRIRSTVFELTAPHVDAGGLKRRILETVDTETRERPLETDVAFTGPLDTTLAIDLADTVLDVVRVALRHVVQRTSALRVSVSVSLSPSVIAVDVAHDGTGLDEAVLLGQVLRAEHLGGVLEVVTAPDGGSLVHWTDTARS